MSYLDRALDKIPSCYFSWVSVISIFILVFSTNPLLITLNFFLTCSIDLENGLTAKVRGYKKDGRHFIEGSYSLFANEGDPVNITYIADNDAPEVKLIEQPTTNNIPGSLSLDDSNTTPTTET